MEVYHFELVYILLYYFMHVLSVYYTGGGDKIIVEFKGFSAWRRLFVVNVSMQLK